LNVYRPAGNRIALGSEALDPDRVADKPLSFYQSGTAALAAALLACRQLSAERNEVILPGYACPDLLSAAMHAGAQPVLVDLQADSHRYDPERLAEKIGPKTLAVISVRFLGLDDDLDALLQLTSSQGARLIVDSAQWFPCRAAADDWPGDYQILSFGRGKPVNLLHGGAVISRNDRLHKALPSGDSSPLDRQPDWRHRLKLQIYNRVIDPLAYGVVSRLPGLNIGATVYRPLERIERMSRFHRNLLSANIRRYRESPAVSRLIRNRLSGLPKGGWHDLSSDRSADKLPALLRYPLLIADAAARKRFVAQAARLGVSTLYGKALPEIKGVEGLLDVLPELPHARQLAGQLVTLPTHEDISDAVIEETLDLLVAALSGR